VAFSQGSDLARRTRPACRDGHTRLEEARDVAAQVSADDRLGERRAGPGRRLVRVFAAEAEAAPQLRPERRVIHQLVGERRDESLPRLFAPATDRATERGLPDEILEGRAIVHRLATRDIYSVGAGCAR